MSRAFAADDGHDVVAAVATAVVAAADAKKARRLFGPIVE